MNYSILFPTAAAPPNVSSTAHILSGPKDDGGVESVKLQETKIAGRSIACFFIGGEARCCLPQILNSILDQISLPAIHLSCDQLQINCSTCTMDQMEVRLNPWVFSRGAEPSQFLEPQTKVRFQQTHNQGLRQLLLTLSWNPCA